MLEKIVVLVTLLSLFVVVVRRITWDPAELARVEAEAAALAVQRDSMLAVVRRRDREVATLKRERDVQAIRAGRLRDTVAVLEGHRAAGQLSIRQIRTVGALQERLRAAFPELGDRGWGLTTVHVDGLDTLGLEYLLVPAWFAETFVIDRANAESWRAQKDRLLAVDSLRLLAADLQDSIAQLHIRNRTAFQTGYESAYAGYEESNRRYVAELTKPRFRLPSLIGLVGAAGIGVVIGRAIP